jgi:hypothetical protein
MTTSITVTIDAVDLTARLDSGSLDPVFTNHGKEYRIRLEADGTTIHLWGTLEHLLEASNRLSATIQDLRHQIIMQSVED